MTKYELSSEKDILIVEYQAAQQSAEHHDNLIWPGIAFVWGGSIVLFGFVLDNITNKDLKFPLLAACFLGMIAIVFTMWMLHFYKKIIHVKYDRCKQIEEKLLIWQHRALTEQVYPPGTMKRMLYILALLNVIAWLILIFQICCGC